VRLLQASASHFVYSLARVQVGSETFINIIEEQTEQGRDLSACYLTLP